MKHKSLKVNIMNKLQEYYSQHNVNVCASTRQNLSSGFENDKGAKQPVQSDQCLCYLLNEKLDLNLLGWA